MFRKRNMFNLKRNMFNLKRNMFNLKRSMFILTRNMFNLKRRGGHWQGGRRRNFVCRSACGLNRHMFIL